MIFCTPSCVIIRGKMVFLAITFSVLIALIEMTCHPVSDSHSSCSSEIASHPPTGLQFRPYRDHSSFGLAAAIILMCSTESSTEDNKLGVSSKMLAGISCASSRRIRSRELSPKSGCGGRFLILAPFSLPRDFGPPGMTSTKIPIPRFLSREMDSESTLPGSGSTASVCRRTMSA